MLQEQGMGGTVYDRDTIMKKYMNGYDGKHNRPATLAASGIATKCILCYMTIRNAANLLRLCPKLLFELLQPEIAQVWCIVQHLACISKHNGFLRWDRARNHSLRF